MHNFSESDTVLVWIPNALKVLQKLKESIPEYEEALHKQGMDIYTTGRTI